MSTKTFQDIYTEVLDRMGQESTLTASNLKLASSVKRWINRRYHRICSKYSWPFLSKHDVITTVAEYTTGTIAVSNGGTALTGTDTVWTQAMTGRKFKSDAFEETYKISKWTSTTAITIESIFNGTAETAGAYTIFKDEYLCDEDWRDIVGIRQYRSPVLMEKISFNDFRAKYPDSEPRNADPFVYSYNETKEVQRLTATNLGGTGNYAVGDTITGDSTNSYGTCIKVSAEEGILHVHVLYGKFTTADSITNSTRTADLIGTSYAGSYFKLLFYPAPYRAVKLDCDVILKVSNLVDWDDEPLIPERYRDIIVYGACADLAGELNRKLEERTFFETLYLRGYSEMVNDLLSRSLAFPQLVSATKQKSYDGYYTETSIGQEEY